MANIISYNDAAKYDENFKYWSNSCGELHHFGSYDISREDLPEEMKPIYDTYWEEGKDGHLTYLAQYKGVNGIALIEEFYETDDGRPCDCNYAFAQKIAERVVQNEDCTVLLTKELGFPSMNDGNASELIVFMPATIKKDRFDEISKTFAKIIDEESRKV